jgi:hypothetical protein
MGTPVISNSTYAFDYIENVDDNDENGNMIKQIDYVTFHKEHPNQKVAIFKNYDGVTYKRLTNAQFNQIKNGNPESITFPDTPSSSTSSEGNENSVKAAYRYYEAKVKGSSGISIEDSPELSPQNIFGGNANTRILNFNTTGLQVLCEVEDKHKKHKLVKSGRRVMIALHNIIIGYASMHTSDNYQLIEITDPSYEQKKNLKEQAKKEKEQAKKVNEQKKDIIKSEKEISLSSTVSSSSNEKHSSLGHTLLELQSEGLNDMDLVKDFVLYQNVDKDTETYWLPNESLLKYVNTGLRDNLEFYTAFLQKINEME